MEKGASELVTASLDAVDLKCPMPVLKARKALASLPGGALLEVLANDPGAAEDFAAFCRFSGHTLVGQSAASGVQRFLIRKAPEPA